MNYLTLQSSICASLMGSGAFAHAAAHTVPADSIAAYQFQGQPAALVRLLGVSWLPTDDPDLYRGIGRVEITLTANPAQADDTTWAGLVTVARNIAAHAHESATLESEASHPGPLLEYRLVYTYKLEQNPAG